MSTSPRALVHALLLRCEAAGQYANIALDTALSRAGELSPADRTLCTALFYSVIEHRITLDHVIDQYSSLSPSAIEKGVRVALRMGIAQLLYFDRIPDHAAVAESVSLVSRRSKGFVNALLRSFCRSGKTWQAPDPAQDITAHLSVTYSVSKALAERFVSAFGAARAARLLAAFSHDPAVAVRVNTLRRTRDAWLAELGGVPTAYAPNGVRFSDAERLRVALAAGDCFVQDEASQLAVAALDARRGMRVLDLCAAPGSKSFGAALDMENVGEVKSFDLHENKLSLIRRGAAALGLTCLTADAGDARAADPAVLGLFDRVIADVPCSGFGVLGKKPDIRYKDPADAAGLVSVQAAILENAARLVREGGYIVYSTCTLLPEENEGQVEAFLARHPEFALAPFTVGEHDFAGAVTLAPDTHGTDGFFIARLKRV